MKERFPIVFSCPGVLVKHIQTAERQPHRVLNGSDGEAEALPIQGVGPYDFQAVGD
jgi:hypothetical protein